MWLAMHHLKHALLTFLVAMHIALPSSSIQYSLHNRHPELIKLPKKIVWAWQRPEDLRWLPANVGVAYVASSITLEKDRAYLQPRMQALLVPLENIIIPVVHVDASSRKPPGLNITQQTIIVDELVRVAQYGNGHMVQLDFEVRRSQRAFLTSVVKAARQRLPKDTAFSITALASWCAGDHWLGGLPVDEIVPMAFRMAGSAAEIRKLLASAGRFSPAHCQTAIGTAIDEPGIASHVYTNVVHYYFSPKPWTRQLWEQQQ